MNGEMSDYQKVLQILEQKRLAEYCVDDGSTQTSAELHSYLTRVMYQKRCKFDPLWNMLLVGGFRNGEAYLGYTDLYGTHFEDNFLATGLGMYMALPLMRNQWTPEMSEADARALLQMALKICYYRDTRASNKVRCARSLRLAVRRAACGPRAVAARAPAGRIHHALTAARCLLPLRPLARRCRSRAWTRAACISTSRSRCRASGITHASSRGAPSRATAAGERFGPSALGRRAAPLAATNGSSTAGNALHVCLEVLRTGRFSSTMALRRLSPTGPESGPVGVRYIPARNFASRIPPTRTAVSAARRECTT